MTTALTPELAIGYLRELSTDLRALAIFSSAGELVAGDSKLAATGAELLRSFDGPRADISFGTAKVFASRSTQYAIVATTSRFALDGLVHYDLQTVLGDLEGQGKP